MHYPWWYVPHLTAPMLIAAIATVHVLVSHYAVGGGLFLAVETQHAYKKNDTDYLAYLRKHAWFFVLVTVVFGAITGVGIWWTIGLASPLATQMLIHTFVFGWAIEYVFFVIEIAAAFIFYYFWGRLDPKTHIAIGWWYAAAAWISLVLITGITAFMLHPGGWVEHKNFWVGFLNPQFVPQTIARTGGSLLLASLYVYAHAAFKAKDAAMRDMIARRSARPALLGAVMVVVGGLGWLLFLPESAMAALETAAPLNMLMAVIFALTIAVFVMLYLGPFKNPGWLSPGFGILFLACGLGVVAASEFVREAVRKPYISYNVVYGNQILVEDSEMVREKGFLEHGTWTSAYVADNYPQVMQGDTIDEDKLLALPHPDRIDLGEVLFMHHCNDCHASEVGLSALAHLKRGWNEEMVQDVVRYPERYHFFMPPWCGTDAEARLLTDYLLTITPPFPEGMEPEGLLYTSKGGQ